MKRNKIRMTVLALAGAALMLAACEEKAEVKPVAAKEETVSLAKEAHAALELVNSEDLYIGENFEVSELLQNGAIRGEQLDWTGEGVFITNDQLQINNITGLELGDIIRVTWPADHYWHEYWDQDVEIQVIKKKKDQ